MKSKLSALFLSLCLAILPAAVHAENKTISETDATSPISINKGDTITFSLKDASWNYTALAQVFSDATIPANNSQATILSWASTDTHNAANGASISIVFNANNSGQMALLFTQIGANAIFKYEKALTFIVNVK